MKTKIKNIILIFVAFMFCMTTMNVSAANPTVDPNVCKDGKVYTNYYYFLGAEIYNESCSSENCQLLYGLSNNTESDTTGLFANNLTWGKINPTTGFPTDSKYIKSGLVPLKELDSDSYSIDGMSYGKFYRNYLKSYDYLTDDFTSGSYIDPDEHTSHMITHYWSKNNSTPNFQLGKSIQGINTMRLQRATIKDMPTEISRAALQVANPNNNYIAFKVKRDFSTLAFSRLVTTFPIDNENYKDYLIKFNNNEEHYYWLIPAVYYIQYCEPAPVNKTLTYDANGGSGAPAKQTYATSTTISSQEPVRSGYTFLGWNENKNATKADSNFAAGKTYSGESTTIYAIWKKNETPVSTTFKIEYDANGGTNAPDTQNGTVGECLTISETIPKQSKNKFLGWSTNDKAPEPDKDENGNLKYEPGKSTYCGGSGNLKLYAVWQPISGVESHLLVFAIVALSAGTALIVTKRKGLFKQI